MNKELKILLGLFAAFLGLYFLPLDHLRFQGALLEALHLAKWYAREHVLLCLVPAFFIAGALCLFAAAFCITMRGGKAGALVAKPA